MDTYKKLWGQLSPTYLQWLVKHAVSYSASEIKDKDTHVHSCILACFRYVSIHLM